MRVHSRRADHAAATAGPAIPLRANSHWIWRRCRWLSRRRLHFRVSSRRSNCRQQDVGADPVSSAGWRSRTAAFTTIWACGCSVGWSGHGWRAKSGSRRTTWPMPTKCAERCTPRRKSLKIRRFAASLKCWPWSGSEHRTARSRANPLDQLLDGLWDVMNHENLAREPAFGGLSPADPDAALLLDAARARGAKLKPASCCGSIANWWMWHFGRRPANRAFVRPILVLTLFW